jgi:hypothetical protein
VLCLDFNFYHSVLRYQHGSNTNVAEESAVIYVTPKIKVLIWTAERNLKFILQTFDLP